VTSTLRCLIGLKRSCQSRTAQEIKSTYCTSNSCTSTVESRPVLEERLLGLPTNMERLWQCWFSSVGHYRPVLSLPQHGVRNATHRIALTNQRNEIQYHDLRYAIRLLVIARPDLLPQEQDRRERPRFWHS
jgi:hypothetical protein